MKLAMTDESEKNFINRKKFSTMVEDSVLKHKHGYMDAIILVCEKNNMEISDVKKFLSPSIVSKLEVEAIRLNFIQGNSDFEPLE
jgi:hypothetical protein